MPIVRYFKGDAVQEAFKGYHAFAHGCNCFNTMGAGVARDVHLQLNILARVDEQTIRGDRSKMGSFTKAYFKNLDGQSVVGYNLYTQYTHWDIKDMLSLVAVHDAFKAVNADMKATERTTLVIPMVGAGLARGNWETISQLIDAATPDIQIDVVVWYKENNPQLLSYLDSSK